MPNPARTKQYGQLAGGVIAVLLAVALLVGTVFCMRQCTAQWPEPTLPQLTFPPQPTQTQGTPGPTLTPNPYGPGDFAYDNGYLTCLSGESLLGVDVSEYQGDINWTKVAEAGVEFAVIRMGFRAWGSQGELHTDAKALQNLQGAKAAGLQVGVYFFSQAITVEEAKEEAGYVLQLLDGAQLELPIVFDWERISADDARTKDISPVKLNAFAMAFCREVEAAGYEPMVYFNLDFAKWMYDLQMLQDAGYGFWLAMYSDTMTYPHRLTMWQYSSGGTVPGIDALVDLNLYFTYDA